MVEEKLKLELEKSGTSIYRLSKLCGIKYELLRRSLNGKRRMSADELVLILKHTDISLEELG